VSKRQWTAGIEVSVIVDVCRSDDLSDRPRAGFLPSSRERPADRNVLCDGSHIAQYVKLQVWPARFPVVDIAELTDDGLIASLHSVYDTSPIRGDFEQARRNRKP
jgi:hypothetical protein